MLRESRNGGHLKDEGFRDYLKVGISGSLYFLFAIYFSTY